MMPLRARAASVLPTIMALVCAVRLGAQEPAAPTGPTVPLDVRVLTDEGMGLGYSVVSIPQQGLERFADASGRAVFTVARGRVTLRVRRLGFSPRDTTFEVQEATVVRVALARVLIKLTEVTVVAWPPCRRPGLPRRRDDPQLLDVIDQLRENVERFRLLSRRYPFSYSAERELGERIPGGELTIQSLDTIVVRGDVRERYEPGRLVRFEREGRSRRSPGQWIMRIPTLADLADDRFIDNHCFHVAGLETKGDLRLLRIDIVAAERLRAPDVNVTVWLDPEGYQLRHARFMLVRTETFPHLLSVVSDVDYAEVVPYVPVISELRTESLVQGEVSTVTYTERQVTTNLEFRGERP